MVQHLARLFKRAASTRPRGACGTLHVVGSPIGNMQDLPPRALALLSTVPVIAAESVHTAEAVMRRSSHECDASLRGQAAAPGIGSSSRSRVPRVVSYHVHNEEERTPEFISALQSGNDVALLSRGGTPVLRDPGRVLIAAAHAHGIPVLSLPGPSSLTAALSVSGLSGDRLLFDGYFPILRAARLRRLWQIRSSNVGATGEDMTFAVFCDADTLQESLTDAMSVFGSSVPACIAKDLSMPFELVLSLSLERLALRWADLPMESKRGAVVLLLQLPATMVSGGEGQRERPPPPPPLRTHLPPGNIERPLAQRSSEQQQQQHDALRVAETLLRSSVKPQKATLLVAQLTGISISVAQAVVKQVMFARTDASPADALPAGMERRSGMAQRTLHLVHLGPSLTSEELQAALDKLNVPFGIVNLGDNHRGEQIAFVRFASQEVAEKARARINISGVELGAGRPVMAGWARRERWIM